MSAGHFLDAPAVVFNLADKQRAIAGRPMTMCVQLNVSTISRQLGNLAGREVVHDSLIEQKVIVDPGESGQVRQQRVLLFGGQFLGARKRVYREALHWETTRRYRAVSCAWPVRKSILKSSPVIIFKSRISFRPFHSRYEHIRSKTGRL